ncbi:MAG TPA: hypothetical protein P5245_08590 [Candidatus Sumerlaeia bacterium]|nr:hypothetical protein [Candidatus Sumerlaeia bacterium]
MALLTIAGIVSGAENRIIPVGYKACGPAGAECRFECLWDGQEHIAKKWCCSHAGYNTPQVHWGIMDLGNIYPITRIVVVHEGNLTDSKHLITEDYKLFGSAASMEGPWTLIKELLIILFREMKFWFPAFNSDMWGLRLAILKWARG